MAIKPTIYKMRIALSDLDRNYYDALSLTVALHPSETSQRMMARVLAYCLNAQEGLAFTKGLSKVEDPDIWVRSLDEKIVLWIEVGEPSIERLKKSVRLAEDVKVYSFNTKSDIWWQQGKAKFAHLGASIYRFENQKIHQLSQMLERTMDMSVTITGESAFITTGSGALDVGWELLQ